LTGWLTRPSTELEATTWRLLDPCSALQHTGARIGCKYFDLEKKKTLWRFQVETFLLIGFLGRHRRIIISITSSLQKVDTAPHWNTILVSSTAFHINQILDLAFSRRCLKEAGRRYTLSRPKTSPQLQLSSETWRISKECEKSLSVIVSFPFCDSFKSSYTAGFRNHQGHPGS